VHNSKQWDGRTSGYAGREIDFSDEQRKSALLSIRVSCDPDSNVNSQSEVQSLKQDFPNFLIDPGTQIETTDEILFGKANRPITVMV
jgi:hypothetical protein